MRERAIDIAGFKQCLRGELHCERFGFGVIEREGRLPRTLEQRAASIGITGL